MIFCEYIWVMMSSLISWYTRSSKLIVYNLLYDHPHGWKRESPTYDRRRYSKQYVYLHFIYYVLIIQLPYSLYTGNHEPASNVYGSCSSAQLECSSRSLYSLQSLFTICTLLLYIFSHRTAMDRRNVVTRR